MVHTSAIHRYSVHHLHRLRVAKIDPLFAFRHHDGLFPVGRVVHVVRIIDMNGLPLFARCRIDHRQLIARSCATHSFFKSQDGTICCGSRGCLDASDLSEAQSGR